MSGTITENGHWVRFVQGIKDGVKTLTGRAYLALGPGFILQDSPLSDAYYLTIDPSNIVVLPWKNYAETRAIINVNLVGPPAAVGGVTLTDGMRVFLPAQNDNTTNGIWIYNLASNTLTIAPDASTDQGLRAAVCYVRKGDGAGQRWYCTNTGPARPGIDAITFELREATGDKAKLDGIAAGAQVVNWANIVAAAAASAGVDIDLGGAEVTGAEDPTTPQSLVTKAWYLANLPAGGVTSVSGTAPIVSSGGATPAISIVLNADASLSAAGGTLGVGVLASDAQHGNRGGGTTHALAIDAGAAGFMSGAQVTKLNGIAAGAQQCTWANMVTAAAGANSTFAINGQGIASCVSVASAGALALSAAAGNASLDSDNAHATNIAATSGSCNIGNGSIVTAVTGVLAESLAAVGTAETIGIQTKNPTAALVGSQIQRSPVAALTGFGWKTSGGGSSRQVDVFAQAIPVANSSDPDIVFYLGYRVGGTGASSQLAKWLTNGSTAGPGELQCTGFVATSGGFVTNLGQGKFNNSGSDVICQAGSGAALLLQTNGSTTRINIPSDGVKMVITVKETNLLQCTSGPVTDAFAATIVLNLDAGMHHTPAALTGAVTMQTSNARPGALWALVLLQDATGGRAVTFDSSYFDGAPTLNLVVGITAVASTEATFLFLVKANGKSVPICTPLASIAVP